MPEFSAFNRPSNINLASTGITENIWVSTAAIYSDAGFGSYWQLETWIFSDDPRQRNVQVIHGTVGSNHRREWEEHWAFNGLLQQKALKIHGHIVRNLNRRLKK